MAISQTYPVFPPGVFLRDYRAFTDQGRVILGVRRINSLYTKYQFLIRNTFEENRDMKFERPQSPRGFLAVFSNKTMKKKKRS